MTLIRLAPFVILGLGAGIVAWGLWNKRQHPPRIVASGRIEVEDKATGRRLTLATRDVEIGAIRTTEVELPGGTWIDCAGDCREAVRQQLLEFWDEQRRRGN